MSMEEGSKKGFCSRWIKKYKGMSPTVRASLLFTVCGVLQKGVSFIVVPIYTRIIPTVDYGKYSVFLSWYQILMIFTTLNMWNYLITNGITEFGNRRRDFIASLQGLSCAITIFFIAVYIPLSDVWEKNTGLTVPMMTFMFAELLTMPSYEYWCAVKRYDYDAKGVVITTIIITLLTPLVTVPIILLSDDKAMASIGAKSGVHIVVYGLVMLTMLFQNRENGCKLYDNEFWKYALSFNLPLVPHFLSVMVLSSSDRIMIERMCGASDAAIYSVAYNAAMALQILNSAILNTFIPYTYKAIKDGKEDLIGKRATPLVFLLGITNFVVTLFAPEIIRIMAPGRYQAAIYVIPPVAMSNLLMFLFNLFANIEYYYKETKMVAVASAISAVANVILNYIFIQEYGFIAAGYTTLSCYVIFSLCHYFFMRRVLRKYMGGKKIYNIPVMVTMVAGFVAVSIGVTYLYRKEFIVARYILLLSVAVFGWIKRKQIMGIVRG